jgi:hypothetical protein
VFLWVSLPQPFSLERFRSRPLNTFFCDRQSYFHVDCFKCAKCGDQVTADTNLLLLSDGSPICANCSYSCNICHLPILDEAIMTGEDSYHAHCFKCKVCKNRIDELVFAKTSQGIYCMNCHSERMAKVRRHAQKKAEKAERERERAAAALAAIGNTPSRAQVLFSVVFKATNADQSQSSHRIFDLPLLLPRRPNFSLPILKVPMGQDHHPLRIVRVLHP